MKILTFWFQVSVEDVQAMQVLQGLYYLSNVESCYRIVTCDVLLALLQLFVVIVNYQTQEITSWSEIHTHIQVPRVLKRKMKSKA